MNFSRKALALVLCICLFMCATTFMVYAAAQPGIYTAQNEEEGEDPATNPVTTAPPVTTKPPQPSSDKKSSTATQPSTSTPPKPSSTPPQKSSNCNLSNLEVVRGTLTPGFNPGITQYNVVITGGEGVPGVKPTVEHSGATFQKNVPVLPMGGTVTATVVVTAEDGTKKTYTLNLTRIPAESSATDSSEDLTLSSGFEVSGEYPSANSIDISGLFGSDAGLITEADSSSEEDSAGGSGGNWLLYIGIVLILGALGGIGFALYRQFFAKPRDDYGDYDDGYYDGDYGDYGDYDGYDGDGYDDPYDGGDYDGGGYADDGYGPYPDDDHSVGGYNDGQYPDDITPVNNDSTSYGGQDEFYDDATTYIPPAQGRGYGPQGQNAGYTRGRQNPSAPRQPDPYRRGNGQQRRNPNGRRNPNDYRR